MFAFFTPYRWFIAAALALLAFGAGWQVRSWRCDAALLKVERANAKAISAMRAKADNASAEYETERETIHVDRDKRGERIRTIYRDRQVSGDCALDPDATSVLREAVDAANTARTGQPGG